MQDIGSKTKELTSAYNPKSNSSERPNVVHQMMDSPDLPAKDKTDWRLALEVRTFIGAGTETTGNTLTVITYHLLADPTKAKKLKQEIQAAQRESSTPLTYQQLARLPYLVGIISNLL